MKELANLVVEKLVKDKKVVLGSGGNPKTKESRPYELIDGLKKEIDFQNFNVKDLVTILKTFTNTIKTMYT